MNHLSLEQCQTLKELGFHNITQFWWTPRILEYPHEAGRNHCITYEPENEWSVPAPTLEELIEWLGDEITIIIGKKGCSARKGYHATDHKKSNGKTPLEAVYNLAVAIKSPGSN